MARKSTTNSKVARKVPVAEKVPSKRTLTSEVKNIMIDVVPGILADLFKKELDRIDFLLKKEVEKFHSEAAKELIKAKQYISAETDKRLKDFDAQFSKEVSKVIVGHAQKFNSKLGEFKEIERNALEKYKSEFEKNSRNLQTLQNKLVNEHIKKAEEVIKRFEDKNETILNSHTRRFQTILEKINQKERGMEKENEARFNTLAKDFDKRVKDTVFDNKKELSEAVDAMMDKTGKEIDRFVKSVSKNLDQIDREIDRKLTEIPKLSGAIVDDKTRPLLNAIDRMKSAIASHDTMVAELGGDVKELKPAVSQLVTMQNQLNELRSLISTHDQVVSGLRGDINAIDFSGAKSKIEEYYQDIRALRKDFAILDRQFGEVQSEDITRKDEFIQLKNKVSEISATRTSMVGNEQMLGQMDAKVKYLHENLQKVIDYIIKTKQQF